MPQNSSALLPLAQGIVLEWIEAKGYGFARVISGNESCPDVTQIFCHISNILDHPPKKGDVLTFEIGTEERTGKPRALKIKGGTGPWPEDGPASWTKFGNGDGSRDLRKNQSSYSQVLHQYGDSSRNNSRARGREQRDRGRGGGSREDSRDRRTGTSHNKRNSRSPRRNQNSKKKKIASKGKGKKGNGDWRCGRCENMQIETRITCILCGARNPALSPVDIRKKSKDHAGSDSTEKNVQGESSNTTIPGVGAVESSYGPSGNNVSVDKLHDNDHKKSPGEERSSRARSTNARDSNSSTKTSRSSSPNSSTGKSRGKSRSRSRRR